MAVPVAASGPPVAGGDYLLTIGNSLSLSSLGALPGCISYGMTNSGYYTIGVKPGRLSRWDRGLGTHYATVNYTNTGLADGFVIAASNAFGNIMKGPAGAPAGSCWKYVILQGWHAEDAGAELAYDSAADPAVFFKLVRRFDQVIRMRGGNTLLFCRYANNPATSSFTYFTNMTVLLARNYERIGRELGAAVVPMAQIFLEATMNRPTNQALGYLYSDGVHPSTIGRAIYPYAFYSVLAQRSPLGIYQKFGSYNETNDPALDAFLETTTWDVIRATVAWDEPGYTSPPPSGAAAALYDPGSGAVSLVLSGTVAGVRLGSPAQLLMVPGNAAALGPNAPVQADTEIIAWYNQTGISAGVYHAGAIVAPGTPPGTLLVCCTPLTGPSVTGTVSIVPEAAAAALGAAVALGAARCRTQ